jgi:hypothetical protein
LSLIIEYYHPTPPLLQQASRVITTKKGTLFRGCPLPLSYVNPKDYSCDWGLKGTMPGIHHFSQLSSTLAWII